MRSNLGSLMLYNKDQFPLCLIRFNNMQLRATVIAAALATAALGIRIPLGLPDGGYQTHLNVYGDHIHMPMKLPENQFPRPQVGCTGTSIMFLVPVTDII